LLPAVATGVKLMAFNARLFGKKVVRKLRRKNA
jgi:hypothetical protein